jgi:hypothetical protein
MALPKKILYFCKGIGPTEEEQEAASRLGTLTFRSAESYTEGDFLESCHAVAGEVPPAYAAKFPVLKAKVEAPVEPPPPPPPPPAGPPNPFAK